MTTVDIQVKTSTLMPRGKIRGSGGDGWAEVRCHPLDVEAAVATAKRIARDMQQGSGLDGDVKILVTNEELATALDGVAVGVE